MAGDPVLGLAQRTLKTNLLLALAPWPPWLSLFYSKQQQPGKLSSLRAAGEREASASKVLWKELLRAINKRDGTESGGKREDTL